LLAASNPGILAAQVCTSDGFEVASTRRTAESHRRLAAIADSKLVFGIFLVLCKNTCRVMGERLATTRY
jgi:hypothetical protein